MVYKGKPYWNWWFGGTTIFGNTHIYSKNSTTLPATYQQPTFKSFHWFWVFLKSNHLSMLFCNILITWILIVLPASFPISTTNKPLPNARSCHTWNPSGQLIDLPLIWWWNAGFTKWNRTCSPNSVPGMPQNHCIWRHTYDASTSMTNLFCHNLSLDDLGCTWRH